MVRGQAPASSDGVDSDTPDYDRRCGKVNVAQAILVSVVLAPGVAFAVLAASWMIGWSPSERVVSSVTGLTFFGCSLGVAALAWTILAPHGPASVVVTFGSWFAVGAYHFPLVLIADRLSLPFLALAAVLSGLIGQFSATYLHREPGFLRFFRPACRRLGDCWDHLGFADRVFPKKAGAGGKRTSRLRHISRLRHWIVRCDFRHASLGGNGFLRSRRPDAGRPEGGDCLSSSATCRSRESGPGALFGMASARDGRSHSFERHLLWGDLHPCGGVSSAASAAPARNVSLRFRVGRLDRRRNRNPRHARWACQRRRQDLARLRHVNPSGHRVH